MNLTRSAFVGGVAAVTVGSAAPAAAAALSTVDPVAPARGTPAEIARDPAVVEAYLGGG